MSVNHRDPITGVLTQLAGNGAPTDVGTAAFKDFTDVVRAGDHRLVEANAVANAIDQGLSSIYTPRGDIACAELTSSLLIEANIGNVYETSDAGTTSDLFLQGADHPIVKGDNVGIIKAGQNTIMFNLMGNAFDLHDYQKKDLESAIEGADTVEGALGALSSGKVSTELVPSDASASNQLITESYVNRGMGKFVSATLSSVGWYKIYECGRANQGSGLDINLCSSYIYQRSCSHIINLTYGYQSAQLSELAKDDSTIFDKIRIVYIDNSTPNMILVHYNRSQANACYATINSTQESISTAFNFETIDETQYTNYVEFDLGADGLYENGVKVVTESDLSDFRKTAFKIHVLNSSNPMSWTQGDNKVALLSATISDGTYALYTIATGWGGTVVPIKVSGTGTLSITRSGDTITVSCSAGTYLCGVFMTP